MEYDYCRFFGVEAADITEPRVGLVPDGCVVGTGEYIDIGHDGGLEGKRWGTCRGETGGR